ncbi:MAG: stage V sporulation protein AB [Blautia sp.]|jgi:stage V sporulation protein AB
MWEQIFLGFVGLCAGGVVASGLVGLLIGLSIVPRFAGITHTGDKILWYENAMMLGAVLGNLVVIFNWQLPVGKIGLGVYGICAGIFLGAWVMALAEMADIFPIITRRVKFKMGLPAVIVCIAVGKALGSLLYFYKGW